jgi:hypothetical protein
LPPSEVSEEEWICRFIVQGKWDDELQQPTPRAFKASDRQLSMFHPAKVAEMGNNLLDLCIERLSRAGEAHLQVKTCVELGRGISEAFDPKIYWRPDKVREPWVRWKEAHVQVESKGGHTAFPASYRSLLAENAKCLRPPDQG